MVIGFIRQHSVSKNGIKATKRFPPENLTRWIIIQSKTFTRKGIERKVNLLGHISVLFSLFKFKKD